MAIAIDASSPAKITGSTASITTAATTTPANVKLVLAIICNSDASTSAMTHAIASSPTLTWVLESQSPATGPGPSNSGPAYSAIYTAYSATVLTSLTVTATRNWAGLSTEEMMKLYVLTGAETGRTGANTQTNGTVNGLPSVAITPLAVGSLLLAASSDWNAAGTAATDYTPGSGQTTDAQDFVSGQYAGAIWHQTALTPNTSAATLNLTAPNGQFYTESLLEIRIAAGAAALPQRLTVVRQAVNRSVNF